MLVILAVAALCGPSHSSTRAVVLGEGKDEYSIGTSVSWLEDRSGRLKIDTVAGTKYASRFRASSDPVLNFGYTRSHYWITFTLENASKTPSWYLEIPYTLLDDITLYVRDDAGRYTVKQGGRDYPFSKKEIKNRKFNFSVDIPPGEKKTVFLRVFTKDSLALPLHIVHPDRIFFINHYDQLILGLYYGFILIMILYNLFIFFTIRDVNYLWYVFVLVCMHFLFQFGLNGLSYELIGPSSLWWARDSIAFFVSTGMLFFVIFAAGFLRTATILPVVHKILIACAAWAILEIILSLTVDYYIAIQSAVIMCMTGGAVIGFAGFLSLIKGHRAARFYLLSWIPIIGGGLMYGLKVWGLIPSNTITEYGYQAGSAIQATLLSLALGDNINILRQDAFSAQQEILEKERREREAQERFSQELESLVKARTDALHETLDELKKKDRILQDELNLAADIQQGLLPATPYSANGVHICAYYDAMEKIGGDFFDIFQLSSNYLCVLISDASGHGIPAAFVTAMAKISFHEISQSSKYPGQIFQRVNEQLISSLKTQDYLTAFMLVISPSFEVYYANASHPKPLIYRRRTKEFEEWDSPGLFIGAIGGTDQHYEDRQDFLDFGDRLLLYTDGLPEARNADGKEFGTDIIKRIIAENAHSTIEDVREHIIEAWRKHTADVEIKDDITFLIVEIDPRYRDLLEHKSSGLTHRYHNNFNEAIEEFKLAIEIDPSYLPVRQMIGSCYYETGDFKLAADNLAVYLEKNADDADAWAMLAASHFNLQNFSESEETAKRASQLRQNFIKAYEIWGMSLMRQDRAGDALPVWKHLLKFDPHNIVAVAELQKYKS